MRKAITKIALLLAFVFAIASCKMGKNYKGTTIEVPQQFAHADSVVMAEMAQDTVRTDTLDFPEYADLKLENLTQDNVLDSLIAAALRNNKNVLIAAQNVVQARYYLNVQNAEYLPKIGVNASAQRGNVINGQIGSETNLFYGTGTVNWEIDIWGKLRRLSESARADLAATEYGYRSIVLSLVSDVAFNYFDLLRVNSQLEISKRVAASRDSMLQIINARFEKGIVPEIDVNQAEIQLAIAQSAIPQYERQKVAIQNALRVLTGRNPGTIITGVSLEKRTDNYTFPEFFPVQLLAQRPDVLAAEMVLISENAQLGAAQAARLPNLSISAALGVGSNDINNINFANPLWSLGGQLAGPLFYFNQLKNQAEIAKSSRTQAQLNFENTVLVAFSEVENTMAEIASFNKEIAIAKRRAKAAINAEMLSNERYDKGVTSYLEYLEQQRQAFDAQLLLEEKRANYFKAKFKLYKALGGGWIEE